MLDSKSLRYNLEEVIQKLKTRGFHFDRELFLTLESKRKILQTQAQDLQQAMNSLTKNFGKLPRENQLSEADLTKSQYLQRARDIKKDLQTKQTELTEIKIQLDHFLIRIPNIPESSVPIGCSEEDNVVIRTEGKPFAYDFKPKDHVALGVGKKKLMDFESAATIAGSRFVVLYDQLARLHRALIQWMLDVHTQEHHYQEVIVPYLVNAKSLEGTGQLPSFEEDLFKLHHPTYQYLIPTGEVPLTNLGRDKIFKINELPCKYVAHTPCFRSEAGSYGQDVKGMIRQHQFDKVELVQFVVPEQALTSLEELTHAAEVILQRLELPYRVVSLCTGDLGFSATKTYDLEVWLPGENKFREISSCSYMGDFQARRLKTRWRLPKTNQLSYVHTLNGSGLAVGRTLIAILENYQQADGNIQVPKVLQPYMKGCNTILP